MQFKVIEFEKPIVNGVGYHIGNRNDRQRYDLSQSRPKIRSITYLCEMLYYYDSTSVSCSKQKSYRCLIVYT